MPLLILFVATTISLVWSIRNYLLAPNLVTIIDIGLGWTWSIYNLIVIGISILMLIDAPNYDSEPWFDLQETVKVSIAGNNFWGITTMISLSGAKVKFNCSLPNNYDEEVDIKMVIHKKNLPLYGTLVKVNNQDESTTAQIKFSFSDNIGIQWRLIELLYCRPGQWEIS
jgi:cellulose synthase (UDP-forming)